MTISVRTQLFQSYPALCDPMDCSLRGSSVHGILQARTGVGCHFLLQGIFLTQGSHPPLSLTSPAWAGRFLTIEPQVLKLQRITLSRNKRAGSDVDIAFFGPHTRTHTHTHSRTGSQHSTIFLAIPCIACSLEPFVFR